MQKNKKIRVCMIVYTEYSGDARVRREAETIAMLPNYHLTVFTLKEKECPRDYRFEGVEIREVNLPKYRGKNNLKYLASYVKFMLLASWGCNKLLLKRSLDIVHIHSMPNFLIFSAVFPLLFGKKAILDVHDTMVETYAAKYGGKMNRCLGRALRLEEAVSCAMAHRVICVNHVQRELLLERNVPGDKIVTVLNAPDPRIFDGNNGVGAEIPDGQKFRLIYHGTVTKRLGVDLAIRAVAGLAGKIPNLEFHVMGGGEALRDFIDLSQEMGLKGVVFFDKTVPLDNLVEVLNRMDLGIVPNRKNIATEVMLPVKMLECVALGIPVVVPRLKAIQYYFSEDMVFYFEPEDVTSMASSIWKAFSDKGARKEKAAKAKCFLETYGWETHKQDLINLYQTL